jgi:DNA polymerase IV (DinB-like DNA polymerase)
MQERIVMLADLDYFFAQAEELRDPELRSKPVVVGVYSGRTEESGAVSTANYVAREYGVRSGIPLYLAKKRLEGTNAVFLPVDYEYYEKISAEIMQTLRSYADSFEQVGIDEAYLDITQKVSSDYDVAGLIAKQAKAEARRLHKISFSVGIGPNKTIAKIACDFQKPDGLTVVRPNEVAQFLHPLPVDRLLGVGRKIARRMEEIGIRTIGDLSQFDVQRLVEIFGKNLGVYFHNAANGIDDEPVRETSESASISRIATLKENTRDLSFIVDKSNQLAADIHKELVAKKLLFRQVGIIAILADLTVRSRSKTLDQPSEDLAMIGLAVRELFERLLNETDLDLRRVGVKVSGLVKEEVTQKQLTSFFSSQ